jgi:hypothetical protein
VTVTLDQDTLSFAFPGISQQLRLLVERHIRSILPNFVLPANREELVDELGSMREFWKLPESTPKHLVTKARSVTDAEIEALLRKAASVAAGLNSDLQPRLTVKFQHPPRPPGDAKIYVFSTGLEELPLRPATDFPDAPPAPWLKQTDFLMPMDASDPFLIRFTSNYPFAVKLAAGNLDAVTGESSLSGLQKEPRNYLVVSGESTTRGVKERSFVLPLDVGCAVHEQFFADQKIGRIDLQICPLHVESYFREEVAHSIPPTLREYFAWFVYAPSVRARLGKMQLLDEQQGNECLTDESGAILLGRKFEDEFDPQYIEELVDLREVADWDQTETKSCSVHVCNPSVWRKITGMNPPQPRLSTHSFPITAQ